MKRPTGTTATAGTSAGPASPTRGMRRENYGPRSGQRYEGQVRPRGGRYFVTVAADGEWHIQTIADSRVQPKRAKIQQAPAKGKVKKVKRPEPATVGVAEAATTITVTTPHAEPTAGQRFKDRQRADDAEREERYHRRAVERDALKAAIAALKAAEAQRVNGAN